MTPGIIDAADLLTSATTLRPLQILARSTPYRPILTYSNAWLALSGFIVVFSAVVMDRLGWLNWFNASKLTGLHTPLEIYQASAIRIIPFLVPTAIPSLRAGLNVVADVLLYVLRPDFKLSVQGRSRERLTTLLDVLSAHYSNCYLVVAAHSQGTVIARDVIGSGRQPVNCLVTAGSPLASLYERFLGLAVLPLKDSKWVNYYRLSDYVGGPISCTGINDQILRGDYPNAHFQYFQNTNVIASALR